MCAHASKDPSQREWLQKIRPYWQHNYHFHVRLKCPAGTPDCQRQSPDVQSLSKGGDGCDETLQWWVTEALKPKPPPDPDAPPAAHRAGLYYGGFARPVPNGFNGAMMGLRVFLIGVFCAFGQAVFGQTAQFIAAIPFHDSDARFGGFSGLSLSNNGRDMVALSDRERDISRADCAG